MANHSSASYTGTGKKTLSSYILGLLLSLVFTFASFAAVTYHLLPAGQLYLLLMVLATLQLIAQVVFFLRMSLNPEGRWTSMSFIFVIFVVLIIVIGSIWIMNNLNYNMVS